MRPKKKKLGPETQGTGRGQESYGLSHVTDCLADVTVNHNINTVYAELCINVCVCVNYYQSYIISHADICLSHLRPTTRRDSKHMLAEV